MVTSAPPSTGDRTQGETARRWDPPSVGLVVTLLLMATAVVVPVVTGWDVRARDSPGTPIAPLHGSWDPKWFGPGTLPAIAIALLGWRYAAGLAERLSWGRLLGVSYVAALAWMLSLAFVDGTSGISRVLGNPFEYLQTARAVTDVPATLDQFISRIPASTPDNYTTHIAGHPPGALLFFVGLVKLGLGGDFAAGMVVTVLAATTALAVMITLRALGREAVARRAAPFLVLAPAAVFMAVSGDALFGAVAAWALACLALGATRSTTAAMVAWSFVAGLLFGVMVMMSYGLPLMGLVAVAVLLVARSWWPLPVAAVGAALVVLAFVPFGFSWWEAYPVLHDRYWEGIARVRPASYWMWGNLAALAFSAGPLLGAGLAQAGAVVRRGADQADRAVVYLAGSAALAIIAADVSRMSKAEVERIWLPFIPWLMLTVVLLPPRWRRWGLGLQLLTALMVQQLFYTSW